MMVSASMTVMIVDLIVAERMYIYIYTYNMHICDHICKRLTYRMEVTLIVFSESKFFVPTASFVYTTNTKSKEPKDKSKHNPDTNVMMIVIATDEICETSIKTILLSQYFSTSLM